IAGHRRREAVHPRPNGCAGFAGRTRHPQIDRGAESCAEEMISRLVLASANPGKLREFSRLFEPLGVATIAQRELGIRDADEPHSTFIENALAKARHASAAAK